MRLTRSILTSRSPVFALRARAPRSSLLQNRVGAPHSSVVANFRPLHLSSIPGSISFWSLLRPDPNEERLMNEWTQGKPLRKGGSKIYGEWQEMPVQCGSDTVRVAFQYNKIFIGDFDPHWDVPTKYNLARIFSKDVVLESKERLDDVLSAETKQLANTFYSNFNTKEGSLSDWELLRDPDAVNALLALSPSVDGVSIQAEHYGVVLSYSYLAAGSADVMWRDVENGIKLYLAACNLDGETEM